MDTWVRIALRQAKMVLEEMVAEKAIKFTKSERELLTEIWKLVGTLIGK